MKRRFAYAQFYDLVEVTQYDRPLGKRSVPVYGKDGWLELNPGWTIDTMAQKAREAAINNGRYGFTLHRATKPGKGSRPRWTGELMPFSNQIEIRPLEIVQW